MTDQNNAGTEVSGEDTAAVLQHAQDGEKTYLAPKGEDTTHGDDAAAATNAGETEGEQPKAKPKQTAQERIDELTRARREAERDAEYWKAKALQDTAKAQPAHEAQPTTQGDGRPDPAAYDGGVYDPQYIEDLTDWKAETAVSKRLNEREAVQTVRTKLSTFESKAKDLFPDGEPEGLQAFRALPNVPQGVADVLLESDIGPRLADHLGANPRELQRISGLSPALQARELTLLETRLADPPKPTPKTATDAPEPAPIARGAGGQFKVAPDTNDFAAFEKQYRIGG